MVGLLEAPRFSYDSTFSGPPIFAWLDSQRPPGIFMVGLLRAPRFSYVLIFKGTPVFVWLDS